MKQKFYLVIVALILITSIIAVLIQIKRSRNLSLNAKLYYNKEVYVLPKEFKNYLSEATLEAKIKVPILMYHYVEYVKDTNDYKRKSLSITPYTFENELQALKEASYEAIFVKEFDNYLSHKKKLPAKPIILTFDDGYQDFYTDVLPLLKKYKIKATIYIIVNFLNHTNFLTTQQLQEISKSDLVEIASHTLNHVYLKTVNENIAQKEIFDSKTALEKIIKKPVYDFAYPYGAFSQRDEELVKKAGYLSAVSVIPGVIQSKTNRFFLYRIRPGGRTGNHLTSWLDNWEKNNPQ